MSKSVVAARARAPRSVDRVLQRHRHAVARSTERTLRQLRELGVDDRVERTLRQLRELGVDDRGSIRAPEAAQAAQAARSDVQPTITAEELQAAVQAAWRESADVAGSRGDSPRDMLRAGIELGAINPLLNAAVDTIEGGGNVWDPMTECHPGTVWTDLRPSEAMRLVQLLRGAVDCALTRCEAIVIDELVGAGLQFAEEHPEAPLCVATPEAAAA